MTTDNIGNMSTDELNSALKSELNQIDGKTPETQPEVKEPEATSKPAGEDSAEGGEPDKNPYRKRIDRLTRRREELTEQVGEKDKLLAQKDAELEKLRKELAGDDNSDTSDTPSVEDTIRKVLDERDKNRELQKSDDTELAELFQKNPNAKARETDILKVSKQYPKLSFEAIDTLLAPADYVSDSERNRSNANRTSPSGRSRADLTTEKNPNKMNSNELEAEVTRLYNSGELVI